MNTYTPTKTVVVVKKFIRVIPKTKALNIYKITNPSIPGKCYVGSTYETLNARLRKHRYEAKKHPDRKLYKECGGIENCEIELLQTLELPLNKFDLERRKQEQAWIDQLNPEWNNDYAFTTREEIVRRYVQSAKGKESRRRYNQSEKGRAANRERCRRYREKQKALRSNASD